MKIKNSFLLIMVLLIGCRAQKVNLDNISGKYYYLPDDNFKSDSIYIILRKNNTFLYIPKVHNWSGMYAFCDTSLGNWKIEGNSIVLNTDSLEINPNQFIVKKEINPDVDSINIIIQNYSNKSPLEGYGFVLFDNINKDSMVFETVTNKFGKATLPSKYFHNLYYSSGVLGQVGHLSSKNNSTYNIYTLVYFDCYPEYFINEKIKIKNGKLKWNSKQLNKF